MPFKVWSIGEEVLAADFNNYVQSQVVSRFSTAAARTAAITAPVLNQLTMRDDLPGLLEYWSGVSWVTTPRRVAFAAYNPGQSVGAGFTTPVTFTGEESDSDNIGAVGSDTMTIPAGLGGVYSLQAYVESTPAATGMSRVEWTATGAKIAGATMPGGGGGVGAVTLTSVNAFAAGTALKVQIINGNGVSIPYSVNVRLFRLAP